MGRKKKTYSTDVKRKCISELMEGKEFSKVCVDNGVAPSTLSDWKKACLAGIGGRESKAEDKKLAEAEEKLQKVQEIICRKEMEIELLKKRAALLKTDGLWTLVDADSSVLSVSEQCRILGLPRSYTKTIQVDRRM